MIRQKTGLPLDAYFSATKVKWLIEHLNLRAQEDLCFGTIDSWLIWNLTQGRVHATDITNASRTLLFNIDTKQWDKELCDLFGIPLAWLPEVKPSISDFGVVSAVGELSGVPIKAVAGDQQAALYGQRCWTAGQVKNTYGTGAFMVMNTGEQRINSSHGLVTTLGVGRDGEVCYALEGSVFVAGAAIQWLRDDLAVLEKASDSEAIALSVPDSGGVYFVPAFTGLGAPYWNMAARGGILGLTRGSKRAHIVRAALEAMAYQSYDVLAAMQADSGMTVEKLAVDGGATSNNFLMQFQADILQRPVLRPHNIESTSLGVAMMAGGYQKMTVEDGTVFRPNMPEMERQRLIEGWHYAVSQIMGGM
jgi:glycerol kinase